MACTCRLHITNSVRCVPPENKPEPAEIATCRFLRRAHGGSCPGSGHVALGRIAHDRRLTTLEQAKGAVSLRARRPHDLGDGRVLFDSFHCSRYNTNTGRLTTAMFHAVFEAIKRELLERLQQLARMTAGECTG